MCRVRGAGIRRPCSGLGAITAIRRAAAGVGAHAEQGTFKRHAPGDWGQGVVGLYRPISAQSKQSAGSGGGTASSPGRGLSHQMVSSTRWRILQPESVRTSRSW